MSLVFVLVLIFAFLSCLGTGSTQLRIVCFCLLFIT